MNKEIHYEGWLIKSPPTPKRVWRARWRRRWFTLKQGEIPGQFCLEYYTDRNCRNLKGVIDLDQCEQVDSGLRLENRKQKFQFLFDIKTPKRTYYLAADTDADMRDWVNCICQVCHLHDTKQSNEVQPENRMLSNSTNNTTTTTLNSSTSGANAVIDSCLGTSAIQHSSSFSHDVQRRTGSAATSPSVSGAGAVIDQQPHSNDCSYVNTDDYTNRDTVLFDVRFGQQQLVATTAAKTMLPSNNQPPPPSPGIGLYLNSPVCQSLNQNENARMAVNANGVVRKIPENLVLNQTPLPETQQHSVLPSPALSTSSGPYIPISECFSGSSKFIAEGNNPTTPLNNLDPKFYDTPRSHNNIGLNLTNDQSYSPKITNCSLSQPQMSTLAKERSHRSDSDSESVFTDDDDWTTHPLPLRENVDRRARPSDSSVENESFVLTFSQRFSKVSDEAAAKEQHNSSTLADPLEKLAKVLKNKNNLILDFKENERITRDLPQLSDTENTSPAIGPRDASSVVEESYDIPRSHNRPYNMNELPAKPNPIAASTPNLMSSSETGLNSPMYVHTMQNRHCYTNAAPSKVEGDVFRYDFIEQGDLPPVNRKLKPKVLEDKPPEEVPDRPPTSTVTTDSLIHKLLSTNLHSPTAKMVAKSNENLPFKPPSIDRKLKPDAYRLGSSSTLRKTSAAPVLSNISDHSVKMSSRTLPRLTSSNYIDGHSGASTIHHQRTVSAAAVVGAYSGAESMNHHKRTVSAAAATPQTALLELPSTNEHKLQYFDLDKTNAPAINRHSMNVGNPNPPSIIRAAAMPADASARPPQQSGVAYILLDFVKTEACRKIREEREKESEGGANNSTK